MLISLPVRLHEGLGTSVPSRSRCLEQRNVLYMICRVEEDQTAWATYLIRKHKLRMYRLYKFMSKFEPYCTSDLDHSHRSMLLKFRSGCPRHSYISKPTCIRSPTRLLIMEFANFVVLPWLKMKLFCVWIVQAAYSDLRFHSLQTAFDIDNAFTNCGY
jgi:hypothetical protein